MTRTKLNIKSLLLTLALSSSLVSAAAISAVQEGYTIVNTTACSTNLVGGPITPTDTDFTDLDGATLGTLAYSDQRYFKLKPDGFLYAFGRNGETSWITLKSQAKLPETSTATFSVIFDASIINTGAAPTNDTDYLTITFSKGGSTDLSRSEILAFLTSVNFAALANNQLPLTDDGVLPTSTSTNVLAVPLVGNSTGTTYSATSALPAGWSAKIFSDDDTTLTHLMPMSAKLTLPITVVGGLAPVNYVGNITDFSLYNVVDTDTSVLPFILYGATGGYEFSLDVSPGKFDVSSANTVTDQITSVLSSGARISPSTASIGSTLLPSALDYIRKLVNTGDSADSTSAEDATSLHAHLAANFQTLYGKTGITAADAAADTTGAGVTRLTAAAVSRGDAAAGVSATAATTGAWPEMICHAFTPENAGFQYVSSTAGADTVSVVAQFTTGLNTATPSPLSVTKTFTSSTLAAGSLDANSVIGFTATDGDYFAVKVVALENGANGFLTLTAATAAEVSVTTADTAVEACETPIDNFNTDLGATADGATGGANDADKVTNIGGGSLIGSVLQLEADVDPGDGGDALSAAEGLTLRLVANAFKAQMDANVTLATTMNTAVQAAKTAVDTAVTDCIVGSATHADTVLLQTAITQDANDSAGLLTLMTTAQTATDELIALLSQLTNNDGTTTGGEQVALAAKVTEIQNALTVTTGGDGTRGAAIAETVSARLLAALTDGGATELAGNTALAEAATDEATATTDDTAANNAIALRAAIDAGLTGKSVAGITLEALATAV